MEISKKHMAFLIVVALGLLSLPGTAFSEGLAAVRVQEKWGYIDKQGKMVIPPKFDVASPFKNGLAEVTQGKTVGYIDKTGRFVWPPPSS